MNISEGFIVERPIAEVWPLFKDVSELARCLPGAELTADHGDGSYDGKVSVKLGPIATSFEGKATVDFDESAHTVQIKGRGVDRSGGSQGQVMVGIVLNENEDHHTVVSIDAEVTLVGPIAQFGSTGLVNEVSRRLIDEFSQCVHAKLDAETPAEAAAVTAGHVKGFSLVVASTWGSLIGWFKRVFSRRRS